jgi:hypothetical protein
MKRLRFHWLFLLPLFCLLGFTATAQKKGKKTKGSTEQGLVFRIEACLANEDPYCYIALFPDMDTFSKMVVAYTDTTSKEWQEMAALQQQPTRMLQADSTFRSRLKEMFETTIAQGKDAGIHWGSIVPLRYELVKAHTTRNAMYEKLAPDRFTGYFFVQDALTRKTFAFVVSEMLQIGEEWYGGYLGEVYEAANKDEYDLLQAQAKKDKKEGKEPVKKETAEAGIAEEAANNSMQKMIAERKYYTGKFDNEIAVQLYVRSLKGACPEGICAWEAIYKFGDQDDYVLLTVTKDEDGDWIFTEVPPAGSMDLKLKNGKYTGTWTAADNQTGYDVKLTEANASSKKIATLDNLFMNLKKNGGKKDEDD